ncbi:MAG TPA: hypothetical protein VJB13_02175 [Candidatus Nanoarchaeia archaeon]|nr:hypothetical protein [Candidatus Nanoarchaeia archaeon]
MNLVAGIIGVVCILVAFLLDEFSKVNTKTVPYNLLNIMGSGLLMYYAYALQSWPFVALNAVWLLAAVVKLKKILKIQIF